MNSQPAGVATCAADAGFLFLSPHRCLRARGVAAQITAPVRSSRDGGAFQRDVDAALSRPRADGRKPLLIGAIPFDLTQPSCLYPARRTCVLRARCRWFTGLAPRGGGSARLAQHSGRVDVQGGCKSGDREFPPQHDPQSRAFAHCRNATRGAGRHRAVVREPHRAESERLPFLPATAGRRSADRCESGAAAAQRGAQIHSNPLAGSAKRQTDAEADRRVADALQISAKDAYEHRLVIEEIRAVLGEHCRELRVPDAPSLISTAAMWHLSSAIDGVLADRRQSVLDLACRLHPTPAVCGSPTGLSRKLIDLIEPFERGLFSGMVGWCDADGDGEWVVTIRCGVVQRDLVRLFAGAGIVEASCPTANGAKRRPNSARCSARSALPHTLLS